MYILWDLTRKVFSAVLVKYQYKYHSNLFVNNWQYHKMVNYFPMISKIILLSEMLSF